MLKKDKKEPQEPQYIQSATNREMLNYGVYYLSGKEKILWSVVYMLLGAAIGYLFYGGIGKDPYGSPTVITYIMNTVIMLLCGFIAVKLLLPGVSKRVVIKRKKELHRQFIDLLDSLSASLSAGQNVPSAFAEAKTDLLVQYSEDAFIVNEVDQIIDGFNNNIAIESMLADLGKRSGIKDISDFGKVFETAYRKGGNIKDIVSKTHNILSTKTLLEAEIETKLASNKNEQNIMMFMPVVVIGMIKMLGGDFTDNMTKPAGLVFMTIGIVMFVAAYFIGQAIMKIDV